MFSLLSLPQWSGKHTMFSLYLVALEVHLVLPEAFLLTVDLEPLEGLV